MDCTCRHQILLTGASGFVGRAVLMRMLVERRHPVRVASRCSIHAMSGAVETVCPLDLQSESGWRNAVAGVGVVVHAAARVHVTSDAAVDPLEEFRRVNLHGTMHLARQAAQAGVHRFIFISSVKVNGEQTLPGRPFTEKDRPSPVDAYGISKYEAEEGLRRLCHKSGMELVVIRPVMVYGPGVKANFLSMMRCLYKRVPLPLGAVHNKRSLVALDNLVDLIVTCIDHPAAANQVFLVSDGDDLSTTMLLRRMSAALGVPSHLVPVPERLLVLGAGMLRRQDLARRLLGSLQVDISKAREVLGWTPPVRMDEALRATARYFLEHPD